MNPGLIYTPDYKYTPRWPFGNDGSIKVVSYAAAEDILPGRLIQALGDGRCQVARDLSRLIGVSVYDPDRHDPNVAYSMLEMVPILRRGAVWVAFTTLLQTSPVLLDRPAFNVLDGTFTADRTGIAVPHCTWAFPAGGSTVTDGSAALIEANFG